ncbi:hypothetical protein DV736_g5288, partial [Chaetothyriales sp. CBS 134916]
MLLFPLRRHAVAILFCGSGRSIQIQVIKWLDSGQVSLSLLPLRLSMFVSTTKLCNAFLHCGHWVIGIEALLITGSPASILVALHVSA